MGGFYRFCRMYILSKKTGENPIKLLRLAVGSSSLFYCLSNDLNLGHRIYIGWLSRERLTHSAHTTRFRAKQAGWTEIAERYI